MNIIEGLVNLYTTLGGQESDFPEELVGNKYANMHNILYADELNTKLPQNVEDNIYDMMEDGGGGSGGGSATVIEPVSVSETEIVLPVSYNDLVSNWNVAMKVEYNGGVFYDVLSSFGNDSGCYAVFGNYEFFSETADGRLTWSSSSGNDVVVS